MKITWILPPLNMSGGIKVIGIYAELLAACGHEVLLITRPHGKPTLRQKLSKFLKQGRLFKYEPFGPSHLDQTCAPIVVLDSFREVTESDVPDSDVVIATWWETAKEVARLSTSKGIKFYFMQDYGAPGQEIEKLVTTWNMPLHIITIAQWLAKLIEEKTGRRDVCVVHNGSDSNFLQSKTRLKQTVPTFGFVYREMLDKGYDIVVNAINEAIVTNPKIRLLAFGPKRPTIELPEYTKFFLLPSNTTIKDIYSRCDAWLFASRLEGFGLPILEAMACRTPVIATTAGAAPELITPHNGALIEPHAHLFAREILRFVDMPNEEWLAFSTQAHQTAMSYTWHDAVERFEAALERACS